MSRLHRSRLLVLARARHALAARLYSRREPDHQSNLELDDRRYHRRQLNRRRGFHVSDRHVCVSASLHVHVHVHVFSNVWGAVLLAYFAVPPVSSLGPTPDVVVDPCCC